jgi:hypothetical protein
VPVEGGIITESCIAAVEGDGEAIAAEALAGLQPRSSYPEREDETPTEAEGNFTDTAIPSDAVSESYGAADIVNLEPPPRHAAPRLAKELSRRDTVGTIAKLVSVLLVVLVTVALVEIHKLKKRVSEAEDDLKETARQLSNAKFELDQTTRLAENANRHSHSHGRY